MIYKLNKNTIIKPKQAGLPLLSMPEGAIFKVDLDNKLHYGDTYLQLTDKDYKDLLDRSSYHTIEDD